MSKKSVSDFQFGSRIGEGSYSSVFKAVDIQNKKVFAIKVLSKKHIVKEKKIKYVNIEKTTLNKLGRHPGIVTLYYTFQDENSLYFVIDLAEYGELLTIIRKLGSLSEICSRFYMIQLIDAVDFMHRKGVIHRDLKPENILVNSDMRLMITDFGAAKLIDDSPTSENKTQTKDCNENISSSVKESEESKSSFVGTAEYVSPELLKFNKSGKESDIWAMGCILFQFITGYPPFKGTTEYLTFEKIVGLQYQWPVYYIPQVIKDLVGNLLRLEPSERLTIEQMKQHKWFQGFNFADKSKIWNSTPPKFNAYNPIFEQQMSSPQNKVLVKKQPMASVKKQNLSNTIREIRSGNESAMLFGPSKVPLATTVASGFKQNAQYKQNPSTPPQPLKIGNMTPPPRIQSSKNSPVTLTKSPLNPNQAPLSQTSQQIKPQTIMSTPTTPRTPTTITPLSLSSGVMDLSLGSLKLPPKVSSVQVVQSPKLKSPNLETGTEVKKNSDGSGKQGVIHQPVGTPSTPLSSCIPSSSTSASSSSVVKTTVTNGSTKSTSDGYYYRPALKTDNFSSKSNSPIQNLNTKSSSSTVNSMKPSAPSVSYLPKSISSKLSNSEKIVKLDLIHGSSLIYSSLKSITKSKDSLDDLIINTIITTYEKHLSDETRGMVLVISDSGLLYIFELPQQQDQFSDYDLLLNVKLTDRSFAMYDYEFDEKLHSGYLILEDISLDLLLFISSIPRYQMLKLLNGQEEFKIGSDMTWIEALMKTKQLLKSKKTVGKETPPLTIPSKPVTCSATPSPKLKTPVMKSLIPPSVAPPILNTTTPTVRSPLTGKPPNLPSPNISNSAVNYKSNLKPVTAKERKALDKKFAGSGAAAAFKNLK